MKAICLNPQSKSARRRMFVNNSVVARLVALLALLALSLAKFASAQENFPGSPPPPPPVGVQDEKNINSLGLFKLTVFSKYWKMFDGTQTPGPYVPYYGYGVASHKF